MKRLLLVSAVVIALSLILSSANCTPTPTSSPEPTTIPTPTPQPVPTPIPLPTPSPTPIEPKYGPELKISGDWIIDNEIIVVTSEHPIYFPQDYHEQYKIIVINGGCLKVIDSYIRSDFRFLLELHDTSKLIVDNSKLIWHSNGAVITNLDSSVIQARDSELDYVGIASGNRPPLNTIVDLSKCSIRQLEIDLFDLASIIIDGIGTGHIEDYSISSDRFRMTLKNCDVTGEVVSWIGDVEATFRNCELGQVSPDKGSRLNIEKCTIREIAPRVSAYQGSISNLPSGSVSSFQLDLPIGKGPSIYIIDSIIENGWHFRYFSESNIEFRNCHLSALRPMGYNYASVHDSVVKEVWIWDISGEIYFHNSPIGWIGNIMNYPGHKNDIFLSGNITVENKNWRERLVNWGETVIRREFFFSLPSGAGDCVIKNEEGIIVEHFVVGTSSIRRVLAFDSEQRLFKVFVDGTYRKTLEISSDSYVELSG